MAIDTIGQSTPQPWRNAVARGVERAVFVSALALGVLVFFRPTRPLGRVLLALWLVLAWPLAWISRALETELARAD